MGLDNLFIEGPQYSETSLIKLPQEIKSWPEQITALVKEMFPVLDTLPMNVTFKKINEDSATAIGTVAITHGVLKKSAYIPLVIKNGMMYPLDIWQDEKQAVKPITDDSFDIYFFNDKLFEQADKRPADPLGQYFNDPSLWQSTYPPLQGRYAYASVSGALLGHILEDASEEDLKRFEDTLVSEPGALLLYKKNNNLQLVEKIAKMKPKKAPPTLVQSSAHIEEGNMPLAPIYVAVRKNPKDYSVLATSGKHFVTKGSMKRGEVSAYLSGFGASGVSGLQIRNAKLTSHPEQFMNDVDHNGEMVTESHVPAQSTVLIQDDLRVPAKAADKFGMYRVRRLSDNVIEKGMVMPVIDYDQSSTDQWVFLGGTNSVLQSKIVGLPTPTKEDMKTKLKELCDSHPVPGQIGCFIFVDQDHGLATKPVQILKIDTLYGTEKLRVAEVGSDKIFHICKEKHMEGDSHSLQRIVKYPKNDYGIEEVRLPAKMKYVAMEGFKPVASTAKEFEKLATASNPVSIRWTGVNFEVSGNEIEKRAYGFDCSNLDAFEVHFLCTALGAPAEVASKIIKTAKISGRTLVHGLLTPAEKTAGLKERALGLKQQMALFAKGLNKNLVKEAAAVADMATVDAVLALNFINPDNIQKFVDALPVLMKSHYKLAELVLASRLGLESVPHDPTVVCMKRMTEVIKGLKALDQSLSDLAKKSKSKQQVVATDQAQSYAGI